VSASVASATALAASAVRLAELLRDPAPSDAVLIEAVTLTGELRRRIDGIGVELAGRVAELSDPGREQRLCRALAERSPEAVLQAYAGLDAMEARAWVTVGEALRPRTTLQGEVLPARHERMQAALASGRLRVATAASMLRVFEHIAPYASPTDHDRVEQILIDAAPQVSDRGFARLCAETEARFVPDQLEERDAMLRRRAGVVFRATRDGRRQMIVDLHPELEGFCQAALDARTAPRRQPTFLDLGDGGPDADSGVDAVATAGEDRRLLSQRRADALLSIMRESLGADAGRVAGRSVTMYVTVPLEALRTGLGQAKIAGVDEPIPASVARRLAADAEIIPCVLGGESQPLDMGRSVRLATEGQRAALAIRDGGCIWPRCEAPPGWCEVAHITPWAEGGGTDLDNLMLLCAFHHRCFDNDGWGLETIDGARHLVPPAWVDSARTPRRVRTTGTTGATRARAA
jgi:5-methylcytosine-specific restriction protein A